MEANKTSIMFHPSVSDGYDNGPQVTKNVDKTGNQINTIYPYRTKTGWAFDDKDVGLRAEPFIAGIPTIIDAIVGERNEFTAHISHSIIPNYTGHLIKLPVDRDARVPDEGWYKLEGTNMEGWLCPATLKYFKEYPDHIYFEIE